MHDSLRLWILCDAMNWGTLPVRGGLLDQDPQLIEDFAAIFSRKSKADHDEREKARRESKANKTYRGR